MAHPNRDKGGLKKKGSADWKNLIRVWKGKMIFGRDWWLRWEAGGGGPRSIAGKKS